MMLSLAVAATLLSAPEWSDREAATEYLRAAGPLALPVLAPLEASGDAETRRRVFDLLRPLRATQHNLEALAWLQSNPTPDALQKLHDDPARRHRLACACYRMGLLYIWEARQLSEGPVDEWDLLAAWLQEKPYWWWTADRVERARDRIPYTLTAPEPREPIPTPRTKGNP